MDYSWVPLLCRGLLFVFDFVIWEFLLGCPSVIFWEPLVLTDCVGVLNWELLVFLVCCFVLLFIHLGNSFRPSLLVPWLIKEAYFGSIFH
uniref:Uncharacterized protein n=1 Tax=Nelumbo nucifera TaxID=4432 RepID=A0A822Y9M8_NELNU|nr:TPA_asm: hypothetical protein HUJ06_030271 [Nelumbo nucifera]